MSERTLKDVMREALNRDDSKGTTVSESPSVTGYLALVEGDIIQAGDEWQTMGDTPEWLIVEEGDINIGKKYLPGTYMIMRRAR